ncbi:hypothetical protein KJ903_00590 [Patescibacteria group bacterium]|nr:hypothetical protein [Patescibacteria group bacterium]
MIYFLLALEICLPLGVALAIWRRNQHRRIRVTTRGLIWAAVNGVMFGFIPLMHCISSDQQAIEYALFIAIGSLIITLFLWVKGAPEDPASGDNSSPP